MPWKKGRVTFDDGSTYDAELLVKEDGQVWNVRIIKEDGIVEEIDTDKFARSLNKSVQDIYPYTYKIED